MYLKMLKGKIHRAVVKQAELHYVGSITVDPELMAAAGILEYENVQIVDIENGNRFETYTIAGEPGSGMICLHFLPWPFPSSACSLCPCLQQRCLLFVRLSLLPSGKSKIVNQPGLADIDGNRCQDWLFRFFHWL